nr:uncharacterized protein LOC113718178 [Coffea arabica]
MRAPPFTDDINGEMVPPNFKLPNLHTYDGRGDPEDHLRAFISAFRLYCVPDAVICRAFPSSCMGLPESGSGESLRSYAQRFNEENVQILIRTSRCKSHETRSPSISYGANPRRKKDTGRGEQGPSGTSNQLRDRRSVFDRIVKGRSSTSDAELTPLNSSRTHVLAVMRQNHLGRNPPEIPGRRDKRNSNLYCAYHRDVGHETEDCNDLKREIENLIRQGYLKQFVRKDGGFNRSVSHRENRGPRRDDRRDTNMHCRVPKTVGRTSSLHTMDHRATAPTSLG